MSATSERYLRDFPIPLIGFAAFSGTGKTTLLLQLLPLLKQRGLRVGVVKHAHHTFDMDYPGKDSYRLRQAGADEMLVASRCRFALVRECREPAAEPKLSEALALVNPNHLDLILVEGFKLEPIPKIELHRTALGRPLLFPQDPNIIALACDPGKLAQEPARIPRLALDRADQICEFLLRYIGRTGRTETDLAG